jgi:hypothetical protein
MFEVHQNTVYKITTSNFKHLKCRLIPAWKAPPCISSLKLCNCHVFGLPLVLVLAAIKYQHESMRNREQTKKHDRFEKF